MPTLHQQLRAWQRREWLYRVAWGAARWVTVALVAVAAMCFTDWLIDRYRDTPFTLRLLMTALELGVFAGAAYYFLLRLRVPSLVALAGRAEEEVPEFDHRLVTALQLNRPGAQTAGMSAQLIKQVTREAEALSARHRLAALADPRRLKWAASVAAPVLLVALGFAAIQPQLTAALLARQCLLPVDIPRSVRVVNRTPPLWPSGDEVELRLAVTGRVRENTTGVVRVYPEDQPAEEFALTPAGRAEDGATLFTAKLPPSSAPFTFRARVSDGRLREPGAVRFEPRPVVNDVSAWVLLPPWVDPAGKNRYERFQPQAEVVALADSSVRVAVKLSKPVASAALVVYSRNPNGQEREAQRAPMTLGEDRATAEGLITKLPARPSSYRVEVVDENGFANSNPPRRGIHLAPDEPPHVNLLPEVLKDPASPGPLDDYDVSGMPLSIVGRVQIGYAARSPLGLARARVMYRVNEGPWTPFPLKEVTADPETVGRFVPELGLFEKSGEFGQVEFYPIPATDPAAEPPGLEAGGRYNFEIGALTKINADGGAAKLEVGDRVEFYVEVFDRNPADNRPPGRSESRIKTVVTQSQLQAWLAQRDQSQQRLKDIEERQRGVFRPKTEQ